MLPEVVVEHNGTSSIIIFSGYKNTLNVELDGSVILPLSDGSYLVGMIFFESESSMTFKNPYPAFFLFDENWDFVSEVPFDAKDFLSGDEAKRLYENTHYNKYDNDKRIRYQFEVNAIDYRRDEIADDTDGRLENWHTDIGVIRQYISFDRGDNFKGSLFKIFYYDFIGKSVKLMSLPEIDKNFPEYGYLFDASVDNTHLIYGHFNNDITSNSNSRSFTILYNEDGVLWTQSREITDEENEEYPIDVVPRVFEGKDNFLVVWSAFTEKNSYQFSVLFPDGREVSFPAVTLPEEVKGYALQSYAFDEQAMRLNFLFEDNQWMSLDFNGQLTSTDPFEINTHSDIDDYQFFVSAFSLNESDNLGTAVYSKRYTTIFDRLFETGDYEEKIRFRGAYLEIIYKPRERV